MSDNVIRWAFDGLTPSIDYRKQELADALALARTSPDLVNAAPALRDFLCIMRNDVFAKYREIYPAVEDLLEWLEKRDPNPSCPFLPPSA